MRMSRRSRSSSYARGTPAKPGSPAKITPMGKMIPATPPQPATPSSGYTETTQVSLNTPKPGVPGGVMSGAVLLLGLGLLYATSTTDKTGANMWDFLFNPNTKVTKSQLAQPMSMLMLVIIMAIFADLSPAIGAISILALTGFWIVWAVENPNALSTVVGKLSFGTSGTTKTTSTTANATTAGTETL